MAPACARHGIGRRHDASWSQRGCPLFGSSETAVRLRGRVISRYMGQAEVLVDVLRFSDWRLAVSGGARRDFDGSTQVLSRLSLSRTSLGWSFTANVYATKPVSGAVVNPKDIPWANVTTSVGATAKVASGVSLGVETVAAMPESLLWSRGTGGAAIFTSARSHRLQASRSSHTVHREWWADHLHQR